MKVTFDGNRIAFADTAVDLIREMQNNSGFTMIPPDTDAEGYIAIQQDTYKSMTGRKLKLPKDDTEARATAMFEAIDAVGAWNFEREE